MQDIRRLFKAVLLIEREGTGGVHKVIGLVGEDVAIALIISHIRRHLISAPKFQHLHLNTEINIAIMEIIKKNNLI